MRKNSTDSLQTYVHKTLLVRLVLMALAISLVVGGLSYAYEHKNMQGYVLEEADNAVQILIARARQIRDEKNIDGYDAFRQSLAEAEASPLQRSTGYFAYAAFYKPDLELIDEVIDQATPDVKQLVSRLVKPENKIPAAGARHVESVQQNGRDYIYVVFPVLDLQQQVAGYTHAIFALSNETMAEMRDNIWQAVMIAVLIVFSTSLLLYPVIQRLVRRLSYFSSNLLDANLQSIALLGGTIAKRDSDTDAHNYRVSIYSVRLAEAVGLDTGTIRSLIKGAFLHDVGKIGIRDNILLKPGRLDQDEFEIMKTHVTHGLDIVDRAAWLSDAKDVVGSHHEKFGGGGYPAGLRESGIPVTARIFAIADVFDALTSRRPYKEPMSLDKTMAILEEGSQQHFDPELLVAFMELAPDLYQRYCGREDEGLHEELDAIIKYYFTTDVKSLIN
jgi:HD-GYP domain-containing protein (c-di-GMP phosphodiesterase class II)